VNPLEALVFVWVFLFGLVVGSFLNVCIHRIPAQGMSIVRPRSHCFSCGTTIRWYDNIPLLSFLFLGARCRRCESPISFRYPFIELLTGAAFLFQAWYTLWNGTWSGDWQLWVQAGAGMILFCGLIVVSAVDLDRRIIPDEISIPGMFVGPALALIAPRAFPGFAVLFGATNVDAFANAVLGVIVGGASVFLVGWIFRWIMKKETMGFGDVKLLAACGGFIGWEGALMAFLLACIIGAATGIPYYFLSRNRYVPFGPSLAAGAMAYFWFSPAIRHFFFHVYPDLLARLTGLPTA
jgi:leader peptidase (prepilin peptidase)/N-methyltransferase